MQCAKNVAWYAWMKKTNPMAPSDKYIKQILSLPWKLASILSQLRTYHASLAKHLHYITKVDSPICTECEQSKETVQHFMLHCTVHWEARQALHNSTGGRNIDITKLLMMSKTLPALFRLPQQDDFIALLVTYHHLTKNRRKGRQEAEMIDTMSVFYFTHWTDTT